MTTREGGAPVPPQKDWSAIDRSLDLGQYLAVADHVDGWIAEGSPDGLIRAIRALRFLGDERRGDAISLRLGRRHPELPQARLNLLRSVMSRRGPAAFWQALRRWPSPPGMSDGDQADDHSLKGLWLGTLRDFGPACAEHERAVALAPDDPWLRIEHSYTLMAQDRVEDALARAREALEILPGYRAGTQVVARALSMLGRGDEAVAMLREAVTNTECSAIPMQLAELLIDREDWPGVLAMLAEAERMMPRANAVELARLSALRADALMRLGRYAEAREAALRVPGTGFYSRLAERLAEVAQAEVAKAEVAKAEVAKAEVAQTEVSQGDTPQGKALQGETRVLLRVPFIRQHWATCAPATLTALSHFWDCPAEHLEVAQAICYDGTSDANQRVWAEQQGFVVRDFRLDWTSACALIDAGVPFALVTKGSASGHLQAVAGYDRLRGTLLIRDPFLIAHAEMEAEPLFSSQAAHGPRAMVMLPASQRHRLDGIVLPDADDHDELYRLQTALERHDREAALAARDLLAQRSPGSLLAWRAIRLMAVYDGNEPAILAGTEALLAMFPDDPHLRLSQVGSLMTIAGHAASSRVIEERASVPGADPHLLVRWAERLGQDSRQADQARSVLRRALRVAPTLGQVWWQWADLEWAHGSRDDAAACFRWAACLLATDEAAASAYMTASRVLGREAQGLAFLREREREWGDRSSAPLITLHRQLDFAERAEEAEALLQAGLARRPDDAALKLFAAEHRLQRQRLEEAQALLDAAVQPAHPADVLRLRALLDEARGELDAALRWVGEACALQPFGLHHRRLWLRLLSRRDGRAAAVAAMNEVVAQHPAHYGLQRLLYEWIPDRAEDINRVLDRLSEHHPQDAWLHRERAVQASRQGRHDEAAAAAETACVLTPERADAHGVLGYVRHRRDGYDAAVSEMRRAVSLDADYDFSMRQLVEGAPDPVRAREAVDHAAAELNRQVVLGDGWLCFQQVAGRGWPPGRVARQLMRALRRQPETWHVWVALARQWLETGRASRASRLLREAGRRFTALPRVQFELSQALRMQGDRDGARQACEAALAMSPGWNSAVRQQVDLLIEGQPDYAAAERVVARALHHAHEDDDLIALLAWLHERQKRPEEALREARRSLLLNPRPPWVWGLVRRICDTGERLHDFDALVDEVERSRPGDAAAWTVRASQGRDDAEALAAAERAVALDPRMEAAWVARFERLARLSRHDEIETLLQSLPWPGEAPVALRAWGARCAWRRGDRTEAVSRMRALLKEVPDDESLWRDLADWEDARDQNGAYLAAAQQLRALVPHRGAPHAYVGHALFKLGRHAEAVVDLHRAVELEGHYPFAATILCEAAERIGDVASIQWAVASQWASEPSTGLARRAVAAACRSGNQALAFEWLDRLVDLGVDDVNQSQLACEEMVGANWHSELASWQRDRIERGEGAPGLAIHWLRSEAGGGDLLAAWKATRLLKRARGPLLHRALLRWLVDNKHDLWLRWLLSRHGDRLRQDMTCWGEVGYALVALGLYTDALKWMSDWRERQQVPLYALSNLCVALVRRKHWAELAEVVEHALPRDPYNEDIRLWELVLLASRSQAQALDHRLARRHEWAPQDWMRPVVRMIEAYAALMRAQGREGTIGALRRTAIASGLGASVWEHLRQPARRVHTAPSQRWRWFLP